MVSFKTERNGVDLCDDLPARRGFQWCSCFSLLKPCVCCMCIAKGTDGVEEAAL